MPPKAQVTCRHSGTFTDPPVCERVKCGVATIVDKTKRDDGQKVLEDTVVRYSAVTNMERMFREAV